MDWTGDGRADLVWPSQDGYWHVLSWEGYDGVETLIKDTTTGLVDTGSTSTPMVAAINFTGHGAWDALVDASGHWLAREHVNSLSSPPGDWAHGGELTQITTGLGATVKIDYDALTANNYHYYTYDPSLPCDTCASGADKQSVSSYTAPLYAVTQIQTQEQDISPATPLVTTYHYYNARVDLTGRGFLGFAEIQKSTKKSTKSNLGYSIITNYETAFPYTGTPIEITKLGANGKTISVTTNTLASKSAASTGTGAVFPYISQSNVDYYDSNGNPYKEVTTSNKSYDSYGNATDVDVKTKNLSSGAVYDSETISHYTNSTTYWCIGRLTQSTVTDTGPYGNPITRESTFGYTSGQTCALQTQTFAPNDATISWTKTFGFDSDGSGNHTSVTTIGAGIGTRTTSTAYDANGRFPTSTTDALGNLTTYIWNAKGEKTAVTGPNGDIVGYGYDGFGRKVSTSGPYPSHASSTAYAWCDGTGCTDGRSVFKTTATTAGAPTVTTEYDEHGREVFTSHTAYGGNTVRQVFYYDPLGRQYLKSKPYFSNNSTPCYVWQNFDYQGRVENTVLASNANECGSYSQSSTSPPGYSHTIAISYTGLTVTTHDEDTNAGTTHTTTNVYTVASKLASVTAPSGGGSSGDETGGTTSYEYDAAGDMLQTTDPDGAVTTYAYDAAGHRTGMSSPSSGTWSYGYDALGELTSQTDPTGNVIAQGYDAAGDLTTRTVTDSAGNSRTSTWHFGTTGTASPYDAGRLASVTNGNGYTKSYTYNPQGDPTGVTTSVDGASYTTNTAYDGYGQVTSITYPDSPAPPDQDQPPVAEASASPTALTSSGTVTLDGSASYDPDNGPLPLTYHWAVTAEPAAASVSLSTPSKATASVNLSINGTYQFTLTVGDGDKTASKTVTVTVSIPAGAAAITGINPHPSDTGIYTVQWNSVPNVTGYDLDESSNGGSSWSPAYSGTATHWTPASAKADGSYGYKVRACNSTGCSTWSAVVTETVNQVPGVPTNLGYTAPEGRTAGATYIVGWSPPSYGAVTVYDLEDATSSNFSGAGTITTSSTAHSFTFGNAGVTHYYRVRACHNSECSGWSNAIEVTDPGGSGGGGGGCPPVCPQPKSIGGVTAPATASTWRFVVHYTYDGLGDLTSVYGPDSTSPYWQLVSMDAAGQVKEAYRAGGQTDVQHTYDAATGHLSAVYAHTGSTKLENETYTYNVWGSRTERDDLMHSESETYGYDADSRMTGSVATLADQTQVTTLAASYDKAGNLKSKTDAGGSIAYTYQSGHPNRLASLSVSGANPGLAGGGFTYSAAGRIVAGAGYAVAYDRRGLASEVQANGATTLLAYAPDGHRYRAEIERASGATSTVWYLAGGAFRVQQAADGTVSYRQAIVAGGAVVGQITTRSDASSGFHYLYHDGLGSTTALAGQAGTSPQALAYAPYGRRREATNWSDVLTTAQASALTLPTRRGYTGGEQIDPVGVVVLGARVYVPALGRWLSPDPAGAGSPYVYVQDNPLSDEDPTGELGTNTVLGIFAAVVAIAVTDGLAAEGVAAWEAGAAGGFEAGFIASRGNYRAGLIGALGGAAMGYLGGLNYGSLAEKGVIEGTVGGALSAAQGGRFADGFIGAFASVELTSIQPQDSSALSTAVNTTEAAALGGTLSALNGGSFANGAISAAFQQLFNDNLHAQALDKEEEEQAHGSGIDDPSSYNGGFLKRLLQGKQIYVYPQHETAQQVRQVSINDFWVGVSNDMAQAIMFLPAPEAAGAIDPAVESGLRWGSENAGNIARSCLLCGTLLTHEPPASFTPIQEAPVYHPIMDMVNDLQRWSLRQWEILTRNLPGGE